MKSKAFYCEACGKPVALKASKCPHCGRLFDSVKCPKCAFSGKPELFTDGCPSCGYLQKVPRGVSDEAAFSEIEKGLITPETDGVALEVARHGAERKAKKKRRSRQLPIWAYGLLTGVVLVLLVIMIIVYIGL